MEKKLFVFTGQLLTSRKKRQNKLEVISVEVIAGPCLCICQKSK